MLAGVASLAAVSIAAAQVPSPVVHSFSVAEGSQPTANLVLTGDGSFLGATSSGGANGYGTIYRLDPNGPLTTIHSFAQSEGWYPTALVLASDGTLYGATSRGPSTTDDVGSIFKLDSSGAFTVLHAFSRSEGAQPRALLQGTDGNLYGVTASGGSSNAGIVFSMTTNGVLTTLHAFSFADGSGPTALIQADDGNLYGTVQYNGAGQGAVFKQTTGGTFSTLHSFMGGSGGTTQPVTIIQGSDGKLYGATNDGGSQGFGVLFALGLDGTFTALESLAAGITSDRLLLAQDGRIYGTGFGGGVSQGTVYSFASTGDFLIAHQFRGSDGAYPQGGVVQTPDGTLFGTTSSGGASVAGAVFRLQLTTTTLSMTPSSASCNLPVTGSASITAPSAPVYGSVTFVEGNEVIAGPVAIDTLGRASFQTSTLAPGSHTIEALYDGGTSWFANGAASGTLHVDFGGSECAGAVSVFRYNSLTGAWAEDVTSPSGLSRSATGLWAPGFTVYRATFNVLGRTDYFLYNPTTGVWYMAFTQIDGTFAYYGGRWSATWSVYPGDFDGDGQTDFFLYNWFNGQYYVALSRGANGFVYPQSGRWAPNWTVTVMDVDGDGRSDLFLYGASGNWYEVMTQPGAVAFSYFPGAWTNGWLLSTGDFDGDGKTDLFLYNPFTYIGYFALNAGVGAFRYVPVDIGVYGQITVGDFNGDGTSDLFFHNPYTGQWQMSIVGPNCSLTTYSGLWTKFWWGVAAGDFNHDGKTDLLVYGNDNTTTTYLALTVSPGAFFYEPTTWTRGSSSVVVTGR